MQFIDQSPRHNVKALSLARALETGRARLDVAENGAQVLACFRPSLKSANAFDKAIDAKLTFNELDTAEKLDLMIKELLPRFHRRKLMAATGRDSWIVHFLIDGRVSRHVRIDGDGISQVEEGDPAPLAFELETDIVTLMALLRWGIASVHREQVDMETFAA